MFALAAALLWATSGAIHAQMPEGGWEQPRVERIRFEGAEEISAGLLRGAIVTEESRCRSLLLQPFCWVADWPLVVERNYLDPAELPRDELRLRVFYARRGYRDAQVESEVLPRGRGVDVVFRIEEGPPTVIEAIGLEQAREVLSRRQIRRAGLPRQGQPLDLVQLDTALAHLATRLGERGFLDAVIYDTVEVAPDERTARVDIRIEPNRRATVRELEIEGNQGVADRTITNALLLRPGRVLRTTDISASQRSLYESNLFHEARVQVPEQPDSAKRLLVTVREAPPRAGRVGGGFNTMDYFQVEGRYTHYNFMGGGRRFDVRGTLGNLLAPQLQGRGFFRELIPTNIEDLDQNAFLRPTWLASADLMQPAFRASANTLGFSLFAHRRIIPAVAVDRSVGAELSLTRRLDYGVPATLSYRYEQTGVEAGDLYFCVNFGICEIPTVRALRERHTLSPFAVSFFSDRANHPLAATSGYRTRLDVEHASEYTLSDFRYHRASGEATGYLPFDFRHRRVLAGRLRAGWVRPLPGSAEAIGVDPGEQQRLLHPRKRFYSGGSRSVRGYGENQLGPRILTVGPQALRGRRVVEGDTIYACGLDLPITACDPDHPDVDPNAFLPQPLGGTNVLEGSVEFRFPAFGRVIGAVFVDGAIVGERLDVMFAQGRRAITPGFGFRLPTPVGPIRADLGIRPTIKETLPVITETVDEEGVRRLVRLPEPREYDPLAGTGGGILRQTLARLTLHLSIGEAY
jgi:outer membrane protein insertion porin family